MKNYENKILLYLKKYKISFICLAGYMRIVSKKIINYINSNLNLRNPYSKDSLIAKSVTDPRIQAEGKAGQSTEIGIIFISSNDFNSAPGSEWIIGTCVKSPCVAAGNNELTSVYR